jgi:hypothetical protein
MDVDVDMDMDMDKVKLVEETAFNLHVLTPPNSAETCKVRNQVLQRQSQPFLGR